MSEPCNPSPCGPNSVCRPVGSEPVCSCKSGYEGVPPECRPECISSSECPPSKACVNQKCQDPCPGACGRDAQCRVVNHSPICVCPSGWTGDPITGCRIIPSKHVHQTLINKSSLFCLVVILHDSLTQPLRLVNICSTNTIPTCSGRRHVTTLTTKPVHTITLRTQLSMPSGHRPGPVRMCARYDRGCAQLPT